MMTMPAFILAVFCLSQTKEITLGNFWHVVGKKEKLVRSAAWARKATEVRKILRFLEMDSESSRQRKTRDIALRLPASSAKPEEGFLAVLLLRKHSKEMTKETSIPLWIVAKNSLGLADPDFLIEFYKLFFSTNNITDCGSLGSKLLAFFPDDRDLKYAFVMDAALGRVTVDERMRGRGILHKDIKSMLTPFRYNETAGIIDSQLLYFTRDKKWKTTALQFLNRAEELAPTERDRRRVRSLLNEVKKD
jgi:hypothetical protein